ncbi:MAG: M3 family oligoendopeptidase [Planctomycetota bacterium]
MGVDVFDKLPKEFPRSFVPADLAVGSFDDVEPLFTKLLDREINNADELEQWLKDGSELGNVIGEHGSGIYIKSTVDTENEQYKKDFLEFIQNFEPKIKPITEKLNRKFYDSPYRAELDRDKYKLYERSVVTALELFREENIPLETEISELTNQYDQTMGAVTVDFEGEERTPQQMSKFGLEQDRDLRERAFKALLERRAKDADTLNEIFEKQMRLREKVAENAGFDDYRAHAFKGYLRFEYTPEDCDDYARAVEEVALPAIERIDARRKKALGLDVLKPWDLQVDPDNNPPLIAFDGSKELIGGCQSIFNKVDPELGSQFARMDEVGLLDLDNRKGKAPGGYQADLPETRLPFIFMNAVGRNEDVSTLLHEGGHAFHSFATRDMELSDFRHAPMEFCEVASMSMELLGNKHLGEFYSEEDLIRARRKFFEDIICYLPWYATIDQFQHWLYTNKGHGIEDRCNAWLVVFSRFNKRADWTGLEQYMPNRWQAQGHLYFAPFYYIEYAIAQIGALQVWLNSKSDLPGALANYRRALALGGTKTLPELFDAAGGKFGMGPETLKPLVEAVEAELENIG